MQDKRIKARGEGQEAKGKKIDLLPIAYCLLSIFLLFSSFAFADELNLQSLIDEALKNNHEILVSESKISVSKFKIPQVKSLPDPMFMFGYQNEGLGRYNYGYSPDAQWMFSASQMFPFPGKLPLKGEMAERDAEGIKASSEAVRLKTVARVKELYYDLFLTYKNIDLIKDRTLLFSRIEDAAIARYSTGMASQQEVIMAQTEKYMLLEREEMLKQKIQAIEAMLNSTIGRDVKSPLGRPSETPGTALSRSMDELILMAHNNSPEVKVREKMVSSAEVKVSMAEKEYYPDFTVAASLFDRRNMQDMWSLTTTINIPIFYRTKQRQGINEAKAALSEAQHELEGIKLMLSSAIRDNYSMVKASENLMDLYKTGLTPKTYQDFEAAIAGYATGKVEAITVISRLKALIEFETLYWVQFSEREKAIARLDAITGIKEAGTQENKK